MSLYHSLPQLYVIINGHPLIENEKLDMTRSFINLSQTMACLLLVAKLNMFNLLHGIGHLCFQLCDTMSA